jgi:hypothetical protein
MEMNARGFTVAALAMAVVLLPVSTAPARAQRLAYCKADAERLCPGVRPLGAVAKCLKGHANEVSIGCAKEIKKLKAEMGK